MVLHEQRSTSKPEPVRTTYASPLLQNPGSNLALTFKDANNMG